MAETVFERVHDYRGFLVGSLLHNLAHGEELQELGDLVAEDWLVWPTDVENVVDRYGCPGTHRSDITAVIWSFRVSMELSVFLSGKLV